MVYVLEIQHQYLVQLMIQNIVWWLIVKLFERFGEVNIIVIIAEISLW